jgi:SAM-dependent methyltransferase
MRTLDLLMDTQVLLDEASSLIRENKVGDAFRFLHEPLAEFRDAAVRHKIYEKFQHAVRDHDIQALTMEDPLTSRAFKKPRGYPGDAGTMDMIYRGTTPDGTSETGRRIFESTSRSAGALSVMFRRSVFRAYIDDTVVHQPGGRILSVASGHCRELDDSLILKDGGGSQFVAIDQDPWVCRNIVQDYAHGGVKVLSRRISSLLDDDDALGRFDLIYAQSLFDYVGECVAGRLIDALARRLAPGGRLVVANFRPGCECRGYMDTLMDWHMAYRTTEQLASLFSACAGDDLRTFIDPHGNVTYAEYRAQS